MPSPRRLNGRSPKTALRGAQRSIAPKVRKLFHRAGALGDATCSAEGGCAPSRADGARSAGMTRSGVCRKRTPRWLAASAGATGMVPSRDGSVIVFFEQVGVVVGGEQVVELVGLRSEERRVGN